MFRSRYLLVLSSLLAGIWTLYVLLNTSFQTGILRGPGIFFYFGQTFGERFAEMAGWEITLVRGLGLVAMLSILFHAWSSLAPAMAYLNSFQRTLGREGRSDILLCLARIGCGASGLLLVPLLVLQGVVYMLIPALTGEPPQGNQFLSQGGGMVTCLTIPALLVHLFTGVLLLVRKCRPNGLLGLSRGHSLLFVMVMFLVGSLLSQAHYLALA